MSFVLRVEGRQRGRVPVDTRLRHPPPLVRRGGHESLFGRDAGLDDPAAVGLAVLAVVLTGIFTPAPVDPTHPLPDPGAAPVGGGLAPRLGALAIQARREPHAHAAP